MSNNLIRRLADEKFSGVMPDWQEGSWSGIPVEVSEDGENFYYRQGNKIFVQRKSGDSSELIPYCFKHSTPAKVLSVTSGPVHGRQPGNVLYEGGTSYSFYCDKCDPEIEISDSVRVQEISID